jgi:hypothetical protein
LKKWNIDTSKLLNEIGIIRQDAGIVAPKKAATKQTERVAE